MEIPEKKQKNPGMSDPTLPVWMIWSNEHRAWWKPGRSGYTMDYEEAGRYSLEEAVDICEEANAPYFERDNCAAPMEVIHLEVTRHPR